MLIQDLAAYFNDNDALVDSNQSERLQKAFGVLTCLFTGVGLKTNTWKMVIMACQ